MLVGCIFISVNFSLLFIKYRGTFRQ